MMFCWYALISAVKVMVSLKSASCMISCWVRLWSGPKPAECSAVDRCITEQTEVRSSSIHSEASSRFANPSS